MHEDTTIPTTPVEETATPVEPAVEETTAPVTEETTPEAPVAPVTETPAVEPAA